MTVRISSMPRNTLHLSAGYVAKLKEVFERIEIVQGLLTPTDLGLDTELGGPSLVVSRHFVLRGTTLLMILSIHPRYLTIWHMTLETAGLVWIYFKCSHIMVRGLSV